MEISRKNVKMNILENKLTPLQEAVRAFSQSEEEKAGVPHIKNAYKGHVVNQLIENTLADIDRLKQQRYGNKRQNDKK